MTNLVAIMLALASMSGHPARGNHAYGPCRPTIERTGIVCQDPAGGPNVLFRTGTNFTCAWLGGFNGTPFKLWCYQR